MTAAVTPEGDDGHKIRGSITLMGMIDPPCPDTQRSSERTLDAPVEGGASTRKRAFVIPRPEAWAAPPPPKRAESATSVVPPTTPAAPVDRTSAPRPRMQAAPALPALPKRAVPPASPTPPSRAPRPTPPSPSARTTPATSGLVQQAVPPGSLPPPLRPSSVVPRPNGRRASRRAPGQEECFELRRKGSSR
jgi:hypothetical protein